jgi:hypothetical protein
VRSLPWLILFAALVVMGGQFAVGKLGLAAGLAPGDIVALRFVGAAVVALPVVLGRGLPSLGGVGWGRGAALTLVAGNRTRCSCTRPWSLLPRRTVPCWSPASA